MEPRSESAFDALGEIDNVPPPAGAGDGDHTRSNRDDQGGYPQPQRDIRSG